jgi:hypothetical protein
MFSTLIGSDRLQVWFSSIQTYQYQAAPTEIHYMPDKRTPPNQKSGGGSIFRLEPDLRIRS